MKLIEMKCPNCKASLEVDTNQKEFFCKYCKTTTLLDDEVIRVEHTVIDISEKLKVAKTYLDNFEDYSKAYLEFKTISEEFPYESEAWWGMILCMTQKLTEVEFEYNTGLTVNTLLCDDYFEKYIKVEKNDDIKIRNTEDYMSYIEKLNNKQKEEINNILNLEDSKEAYNILKRLSKKKPYESEIWWGLVLFTTNNFLNKDLNYNGDAIVDITLSNEYFDKYLQTERNEQQKEINSNKYLSYREELKNEIKKTKNKIEDYEEHISKIVVISIIVVFLIIVILAIGIGLLG